MNRTTTTALIAATVMSVLGMSTIGNLLDALMGQFLMIGSIVLLDASLNYMTKSSFNPGDDVAVVPGFASGVGFLCGALAFLLVGVSMAD